MESADAVLSLQPPTPPPTPVNYIFSKCSSSGRDEAFSNDSITRLVHTVQKGSKNGKRQARRKNHICKRTFMDRSLRTFKYCDVCGLKNHIRRKSCKQCGANRIEMGRGLTVESLAFKLEFSPGGSSIMRFNHRLLLIWLVVE